MPVGVPPLVDEDSFTSTVNGALPVVTPPTIAKAAVTVSGQSFSGTGKRYMLADASTHAVAVTGSVPAASIVSLNFSDSAGGSSTSNSTSSAMSQ